MNRQKLISFIGRQVKGNWVSIILILTSSSINFKWLIRPESPGASSLLVWSLSSSQFWGFRVQFSQLIAHEMCGNLYLFKYILEVNTYFYVHEVITVKCVSIFVRTPNNIQLFLYKTVLSSATVWVHHGSGPVCHLLWRTADRRAAFTSISQLALGDWAPDVYFCAQVRSPFIGQFLHNFKMYIHLLKEQIYSNSYLSKH